MRNQDIMTISFQNASQNKICIKKSSRFWSDTSPKFTRLAGAGEYTDCFLAEGSDPTNECPENDTK